jgi:hypothetical protein
MAEERPILESCSGLPQRKEDRGAAVQKALEEEA